jgi:hypothetical protein
MLQIELRHDASPCFGWLHFNREQLGGFKRSSQQPLSASLYGWL